MPSADRPDADPDPTPPKKAPRRGMRAPSARRFAAGALASFVAVFGVLALRVHNGDDPGLASVAKATSSGTTSATGTSTSTDSTTSTSDPYTSGTDTTNSTSTSSDNSSSSSVSSTPSASTSAS
jgi:hypothetical protein